MLYSPDKSIPDSQSISQHIQSNTLSLPPKTSIAHLPTKHLPVNRNKVFPTSALQYRTTFKMSDANTQQQFQNNSNAPQGQRGGFMSGSGFMAGNGLLGIRGRRQQRRCNRRGGRQGRGFGLLAGIRNAITNRGSSGDAEEPQRSSS